MTKYINKVPIKVPFINGIGLTNFVLKTDWLDSLIKTFTNDGDETFIDVGVNIGQTILSVKTLRPKMKYQGFEPNSTCASYSQQLVKLNSFDDCIIHNCALSQKVQILVLEKTLVDDSRASVISSLRPGFFSDKEYVLALDFDSFFINQPISFVKIDVEGAELDVLLGMKQALIKYQPIITCEVLDSFDPSVFEFTQNRATKLSELLKYIHYSIIQLETSREKNKIVSFTKINTVILKQWSPKSCDFNDYLFYPANKESEVIDKLSLITA